MSAKRLLPVIIICALVTSPARPFADDLDPPGAQQSASARATPENEAVAKQHYKSAVSLLGQQNYREALKDLDVIILQYENSSVIDDALLLTATYRFEIENNLEEAKKLAETLVTKHGGKNAVPGGYLILGRIALARGRTTDDFGSAIAAYGRVQQFFAGNSEAVPEALYRMAESYRLSGQVDEAIRTFRQTCSDYSRSPWCSRATLGLAQCLVRTGQWRQAIEKLQWVRTSFPGTPESERAYQWNTILFRLYVRPSLQLPPFALNPRPSPGGRVKDVQAMAVNAEGRVFLALKGGVRVLDAAGANLPGIGSVDCQGVFLTQRGAAVAIQQGRLVPEQGQPTVLSVIRDAKPRPIDDVPAAVAFSTGEFLVSDNAMGALEVFSPKGDHLKPPFSKTAKAARLAVNELDDVAVLEQDSKTIYVLRRSDGTRVSSVPSTGQGFAFRNPVDIAFDPLGHLYVLDRDSGSVVVFNPVERAAKFVASFSLPEKTAGSFQRARAFALDPFGRLFVFDDRAESVRIYQ
jgi:TolA-binding protein